MSKFVKIPIVMTNRRQEELTGKSEQYETFVKVNPDFVMDYMPSAYEKDGDTVPCSGITIGGQIMSCLLPFEELDKLLDT